MVVRGHLGGMGGESEEGEGLGTALEEKEQGGEKGEDGGLVKQKVGWRPWGH